jgi:hypothetical protein
MKKQTVEDVLKDYLEEEGFNKTQTSKILKTFNGSIKEEKKIQADKDKEEERVQRAQQKKEEAAELRTGTSCFGVISQKHKEVLFEN